MGHSISKPSWHSPQPHHRVVVEPASTQRKARIRGLFGSRKGSCSEYTPQDEQGTETHNLPLIPTQPRRNTIFNRSSNCNQPRPPVAHVIVHRPSARYRVKDYRTSSPISSGTALTIPVAKKPPLIGGRRFHPPQTLALMDVGSRLAERGKEAKNGWKESLRAERERRFNDSCREYVGLKVETEQDVYNRTRKEQKREAKRQKVYTV